MLQGIIDKTVWDFMPNLEFLSSLGEAPMDEVLEVNRNELAIDFEIGQGQYLQFCNRLITPAVTSLCPLSPHDIHRQSWSESEEIIRIPQINRGIEVQTSNFSWDEVLRTRIIRYRVSKLDNDKVYLEFPQVLECNIYKPLTLILGLCRPPMMKRIFEWLPALPIRELLIVCGENSEKSILDSRVLKEEALTKSLLKGIRQAATPFLPKIRLVTSIKKLIETFEVGECQGYIGDDLSLETVEARSAEILENYARISLGGGNYRRNRSVMLAIGPERGWTRPEKHGFEKLGLSRVSVGNGILRVDAAVSALSIACKEFLFRKG